MTGVPLRRFGSPTVRSVGRPVSRPVDDLEMLAGVPLEALFSLAEGRRDGLPGRGYTSRKCVSVSRR
jgi:hypothetical protein